MRSKNTELMKSFIDFIDKTYELTGRTPSYCEIAEEFSVTSACVCKYIKEMANRNMLTIQAGFRGIVTEKMKQTVNTINIPVVGSIACGSPLLAQENIETYLPISKDFLGNGNFFILIAKGDSMIDANINDGDYVIVRQQESAEQGQIVVALINDEATLKRYYLDKRKKKVRLHPENKDMEDMYFDNIVIQGVAIKVIKDLI